MHGAYLVSGIWIVLDIEYTNQIINKEEKFIYGISSF